jgi:cellobiose-specific phosphotransferase system component IIC
MANKAASKKEVIIPIRVINDELLIRFKSLEERNRIEEHKKLETQRKTVERQKIEKQKKLSSVLQKIILFILIVVVGSFLYLLVRYVNPKNTAVVTNVPSDVKVSLAYSAPKYLAVGDENIVEITLSNSGSTPFNGVVTLVISDLNNSVASTLDRTMSIPVKDLLPNDRLTSQYKIKLSKNPAVTSLEFHFQISLLDENSKVISSHKTSGGQFFISPITRLRSIWVWVTGGSGLIVLVINFLFERFKNLLGVQK